MKTKIILTLLLMAIAGGVSAQKTGFIRGTVKDKNTEEVIPGALIRVDNSTIAGATDDNGNYTLTVPIGTQSLTVQSIGYAEARKFNIVVTTGNDQIVNVALVDAGVELAGVEVTVDNQKSADASDMTTPLSVQQLTTEEIRSNPGGNFDVSRVVQTLPGIGSSSAGGGSRNDIIIRGGAPNENVYYLDGIEIPVINHFQTQGSSGGAQGILNVSFIEDLKLSTSAFDARYDNALAGTFVINQRDGNPNHLNGNIRADLTETALVLEGPIGKKTTYLVSSRKSYLDLLFKWIDIPIRPNYYDFQYKITHKFDAKNSLTALGIGAIDNFSFATNANSTPENVYITRSLPYINQWNYTTGFIYKHQIEKGSYNISFSRNMFENKIEKYEGGLKNGGDKIMNLVSSETENKLKFDYNKYTNGWKITAGLGVQYAKYLTDFYMKSTTFSPELNEQSALDLMKFGGYAQLAKSFMKRKLLVSAGARTDMNDLTTSGLNPLKTLSPRLSMSYKINSKFSLTSSVGTYYKLPTYTALGYRDFTGELINKDMEYIQSTHYIIGTEYIPNQSLRFVVESFFKKYSNYPVSIDKGISIANIGSDFGSVGSEALISSGTGEVYGVEFSVQQKLVKRLFYVASYSYIRSLFAGVDGKLLPSAWDNGHILSVTLGYKFKRDYEFGMKYRYAGGNPYTPFDLVSSQSNYMQLGTGILDYTKINQSRLMSFNQLDVRLDKKINFKKFTVDVYIDVQNILMFQNQSAPNYTFKRTDDNSAFATTDNLPIQADGSNGIPVLVENKTATVIPTIGVILQF